MPEKVEPAILETCLVLKVGEEYVQGAHSGPGGGPVLWTGKPWRASLRFKNWDALEGWLRDWKPDFPDVDFRPCRLSVTVCIEEGITNA